MPITLQVLHCDETGEELLCEALRVLDADVLGTQLELRHHDLSLANRRATQNRVVIEASHAMRETGYGLKAATITPEGPGDGGSPNAILRAEVGGTAILRTGRRIPAALHIARVS